MANKTPEQARALISNMAANAQQFGTRQDHPPRQVNEVSASPMDHKLDALTSLLEKLVVGQVQQVKTCGICSVPGHPTNMCPTLQEDPVQQANAIGGFPGQPQRRYDPYSNTYNPGWIDHPNFSYRNQGGQQGFPQQNFTRPPAPAQSSNSGMSLDEFVKALATNTQQFQQETRASIQNLGNQISQLASSVSRLEAQNSGKLPSQTVVNPKENASAIVLRSGKEIEAKEKVKSSPSSSSTSNVVVPPFPCRLEKSKKVDYEKEVLETFRKVEINIPLLDAIKQIPKYAKFLKELCTNKRRLHGDEKVSVGENVSAVIKRILPNKCKDPGKYLIGFFLFLSLTIYTATKVPNVVDFPRLQNFPDVLRKADFQKLHAELITCLPSLPHMPDMHRLQEELKTSLHSMDLLPSLSNWHIMELLSNCLPESLSHSNHTDACVLRSMKEDVANIVAPTLAVLCIPRRGNVLPFIQQHVPPPLLSLQARILHHALPRLRGHPLLSLRARILHHAPPRLRGHHRPHLHILLPPLYYYSFMCHPFFCNLYVGFITLLGIGTILVSLLPVFQNPEYSNFRAGGLFFGMGFSGATPIL